MRRAAVRLSAQASALVVSCSFRPPPHSTSTHLPLHALAAHLSYPSTTWVRQDLGRLLGGSAVKSRDKRYGHDDTLQSSDQQYYPTSKHENHSYRHPESQRLGQMARPHRHIFQAFKPSFSCASFPSSTPRHRLSLRRRRRQQSPSLTSSLEVPPPLSLTPPTNLHPLQPRTPPQKTPRPLGRQ